MKIVNNSSRCLSQAIPQSDQGDTRNCHWQSRHAAQQTFSFINQKGGVGKSSACFHLAGAFASMSMRVLVIDTDPQGSISQGFLGSEYVESLDIEDTVAVLFGDAWSFCGWSRVILPTRFDAIHLVAANQWLARHNEPRPEESGPIQFSLREFVESQSDYDVILIDCPPNLYRCTWTSMIASDWVVIPVTPEDFGTQGLRAVHQAIDQVQLLNPHLNRLGHLVTRSDGRLLVHKHYERRLRSRFGREVLNNFMPELSAFKLAVANRSPVEYFGRSSRAARLTRRLAREILDRANGITQGREAA